MKVFLAACLLSIVGITTCKPALKKKRNRHKSDDDDDKDFDRKRIRRLPRATILKPPRPYFPEPPQTPHTPPTPPVKPTYRRITVRSIAAPQSFELKWLFISFIALLALTILVSIYLVFKKDLKRLQQRGSRLFFKQ